LNAVPIRAPVERERPFVRNVPTFGAGLRRIERIAARLNVVDRRALRRDERDSWKAHFRTANARVEVDAAPERDTDLRPDVVVMDARLANRDHVHRTRDVVAVRRLVLDVTRAL